eukprot:943136-Alexandrium_andersonii.AAC.1
MWKELLAVAGQDAEAKKAALEKDLGKFLDHAAEVAASLSLTALRNPVDSLVRAVLIDPKVPEALACQQRAVDAINLCKNLFLNVLLKGAMDQAVLHAGPNLLATCCQTVTKAQDMVRLLPEGDAQ